MTTKEGADGSAERWRVAERISPWPLTERGVNRRADLAYLSLSVLLGTGLLIQQFNEQWSSDVFVHIASIREFSTNGLSAENPFIGGDVPDAYLTPFHFLAGSLLRLSGWSVTTTLAVVGLVNLGILLVALRAFVRLVCRSPWAPSLTLVFTVVAWGIGPWRWSGYLNLNSIGFGLPYPSVFAMGVGLLSVVAVVRYLLGETSSSRLAAAAVGGAVTVLSHPLTALWMVVLAAAVSAASLGHADRRRIAAVVAAGIGACALSLAWPAFSLLDVIARNGSWEARNQGLYQSVLLRTFLAAPGVAALWFRARRRLIDPLVLAGVLLLLLYVAGFAFGRGTLGRSMPGLLLVLHVAFADMAASVIFGHPTAERSLRRLAMAVVGVTVVVGLAGIGPGLLRVVPRPLLPGDLGDDERFASITDPWEGLSESLPEGAVMAAPDGLVDEVAAFGGRVVASSPNAPSLRPDDRSERIRARDAILADPDSPAARAARERYGVTHLVVARRSGGERPPGRVVVETTEYFVVVLESG